MARILVVDDEKSIRYTFKVFLNNENHDVFLADNALSAFDIVNNNNIDLIITDIMMPGITGVEMLNMVKSEHPDLPVVLMTGEPNITTAQRAIQGGAVDYLFKPVTKNELIKTVVNVLNKKALLENKKVLEEEVKNYSRRLEKMLAESTQALETTTKMLELSPIPSLIVDLDKKTVIRTNRAVLDFLGVEDMKPLHHRLIFQDPVKFKIMLDEYFKLGKLDNYKVDITRIDNRELVRCLISMHPIQLNGQNLVIITFTNINELLEANARLETSKKKAEDLAQAKSQFLANMSHEIRTPMNAVIGLSELLADTNLDAKQKEYVDKLNLSANNLLSLINDILDFSKLESGKLTIETIDFSLAELINNITTIMSINAEKKGLKFIIKSDDNIPAMLKGDKLRLEQVLINLFSNAVKFTESGDITLKVEKLSESEDSLNLKFSLKDTGIGIEKERQSKLFEVFTQADSTITRKFGGSGLGLAICKKIVTLMGGEIWFYSKVGIGSTFFFTVNLGKSPITNEKASISIDSNNPEIINLKRNTLTPTHINNKKILLVEDNEINQLVTTEMLKTLDYLVDIANNGKEAVDKVNSYDYDLILMDLQMPVMDGYTATTMIRMQNHQIPIIALSADVLSEFQDNATKAGMNDCLSKPIAGKDLENVLNKWLY